jgi:hypothetical protein
VLHPPTLQPLPPHKPSKIVTTLPKNRSRPNSSFHLISLPLSPSLSFFLHLRFFAFPRTYGFYQFRGLHVPRERQIVRIRGHAGCQRGPNGQGIEQDRGASKNEVDVDPTSYFGLLGDHRDRVGGKGAPGVRGRGDDNLVRHRGSVRDEREEIEEAGSEPLDELYLRLKIVSFILINK